MYNQSDPYSFFYLCMCVCLHTCNVCMPVCAYVPALILRLWHLVGCGETKDSFSCTVYSSVKVHFLYLLFILLYNHTLGN